MSAARRRLSIVLLGLAVLVAAASLAPSAGAHAQLRSTTPEREAVLKQAPPQVEFRFSEHVEAAFGAVRVFDGDGKRVDSGAPIRPDGSSSIGVHLKSGLPDGSYTVTYHVVSADSHPVSGGFVFHVGDQAVAPVRSVASYLATQQSPLYTRAAYTVDRLLGYLALCLLFGVAFFAKFIFTPAAREASAAGADVPFAERADRLQAVGVTLGLFSAAAAIVFQGAVAAGEGVISGFKPSAIDSVIGTRSGMWMLVRLAIWAVILIVWFARGRGGSRRGLSVLLALGALAALTPGLIGHAAVTSPVWLMIPFDFIHVAAMTLWVGGLAAAALALPQATRVLAPTIRTRLLVEVFSRFSALALIAVGALVATGVFAAIIQLDEISELISTAYGRAILIKSSLLIFVILVATVNRFVVIPQLRERADGDADPGDTGRLLKRMLTTELALTFVIVAVASALVGFAPAKAANAGPFVTDTTIGPADMQLIVDPARSGGNQVHLYLTDPRSGAQFERGRQITIDAARTKPQLGPFSFQPQKAGPGHYVVPRATFPGAGDWTLDVVVRVSEFEEYERKVAVKIR